MGRRETIVVFGVPLKALVGTTVSIEDLKWGAALAKPEALTLYRFYQGSDEAVVNAPARYCTPGTEEDAQQAADAAAKRLPPMFRNDAKFIAGMQQNARDVALKGVCKWVWNFAELDALKRKNEDEEQDELNTCIAGYLLAELHGSGALEMNAEFFSAVEEARLDWTEKYGAVIHAKPVLIVIGG